MNFTVVKFHLLCARLLIKGNWDGLQQLF